MIVRFVARGRIANETTLTRVRYNVVDTIPPGFVSDGASIPPLAWPLVGHPYAGSLIGPAFWHDWDIAQRADPPRVVHARFYRALRANGVGRFRAGVFWLACVLFGSRW